MPKSILVMLLFLLLLCRVVTGSYLPSYNLFYSGEITMSGNLLPCINGELNLKSYDFYLHGEPLKDLMMLFHLYSGGKTVDQFYIDFSRNPFKLKAGDFFFESPGDNFFADEQILRGIRLLYSPLEDWDITFSGAMVTGINRTDEFESDNESCGPFFLSFIPVVPGSEKVRVDEVLLKGEEYDLDYQTGVLYLTEPLKEGQKLKVSYSYLPGGGLYEKISTGFTVTKRAENLNTSAGFIYVRDNPLKEEMNLISRKLKGVVLTVEFNQGNLVFNNEMAFSELEGEILESGSAYHGELRIGDYSGFLKGEYTYRSNDFYTTTEKNDALPLKEIILESRKKLGQDLYVSGLYRYSDDNPEQNPDLITTYELERLFKVYWQRSPISYYQLVFRDFDTGDDLLYLPAGKRQRSLSLAYSRYGECILRFELDGGELRWKSPSSQHRNYNFLKAGLEYERDFKDLYTRFELKAEYLQPLNETLECALNSCLDYHLEYKLKPGKLVLSGQEEAEGDFHHRQVRAALKKTLLPGLYTVLGVSREVEGLRGNLKKHPDRWTLEIFYPGKINLNSHLCLVPLTGEIESFFNLSFKEWEARFKLSREGNDVLFEQGLKWQPFSWLELDSCIGIERSNNKWAGFNLNLDGRYRINRWVTIKFAGEKKEPSGDERLSMEMVFSF